MATSDTAVPTTESRPGRPGLAARTGRVIAGHRAFAVVLAVAVLLRSVVMLGYPPAMFFNDSYNYLIDAVTGKPDAVRANGYPFLLWLLQWLHNLSWVAGLQALMGLAVGILIYALLRRRGLPWWGATLCALPVLFDAYELQIEHTVASDVLFYTLLMVALVLLSWWDRPPLPAAAVAGLLVGYAATVRNVGEIMLAVLIVGMLARRLGWRRIAAAAAAGLAPMIGYMFWYQAGTGHFAMSAGDGTFLYSRVQTFAECTIMHPPPNLTGLCDPRPQSQRENSQEYLWANDTPLARWTGDWNAYRFTPEVEKSTMAFAQLAIERQPVSYAKVVLKDVGTTFEWQKVNANNPIGNLEGDGSKFRFTPAVWATPNWVTGYPVNQHAVQTFGGASYGRPAVVQPWAGFLWLYQNVYLRGPLLLLFVLAGLAGVVLGARRREWGPLLAAQQPLAGRETPAARSRPGIGGLGLLPWLVGVALIVLPPMTAGFSYRYDLAAVPALCLAAGLAFAGRGNLITAVQSRVRSRVSDRG